MRVRSLTIVGLAWFAGPVAAAFSQSAPPSPGAPVSSPVDTVRIAGRVTLGSSIIESDGISIYIQDSTGAGIHVTGRRSSDQPRLVAGDSVVVIGTRSPAVAGLEVADATATLVPGPRRVPAIVSTSLDALDLEASTSRLVRIAGTVTEASLGRSDHLLKLVNRLPGSDSSAVYIVEPDASADPLGLERFDRDDDVRVVGVLVRRGAATDSGSSYYLFPRSAADLTAIGWTRAERRDVRGWTLAITALLALLIAGIHVRREVRAAKAHADAVLRESESRYRLLVEEAPVGILVHRRGRVLFVNSAFATLLGLSEDRVLGIKLVDLIHSGDRSRAAVWIRALRNRRQRAVRGRERFRRLDGKMIEIEIAATRMTFRGVGAVQVVVHDVTTHAVLEEQLRHSQKMEAIGQLAAGVAHDFNNILTTISGYTQLILDDYTLDEPLQKDVEEIHRAGERASTLTKQLLAVSRRQLVLAEVIDLNEVITSAEHLFDRTIGAQITLDVALAAEPCHVFADRGQLEQVLMNLVLNARDAMPEGGLLQIETRVTNIDDAETHVVESGEYVTLIVRDSGVGMSPETQRRIFDPFFTTKPVGDGTGLGLATMYGIVTGAHGHVSVTSTEGAGSEFTVLLPRVEPALEVRPVPETAATRQGDGARVLLIEDETSVRTAARRILERGGYRVAEARNGADALLLWHEEGETFDCIVTDVVLPGLRGPELVERFRADRPEIPVLFVSGYTDRALGRLDLEVPNTAFLQKPFEPRRLAAALSDLLHQSAVAA